MLNNAVTIMTSLPEHNMLPPILQADQSRTRLERAHTPHMCPAHRPPQNLVRDKASRPIVAANGHRARVPSCHHAGAGTMLMSVVGVELMPAPSEGH